MGSKDIADLAKMEELITNNLQLFSARRLLELKIFRHDPRLVIDPKVVLVKYLLTIERGDGTIVHLTLRGSADLGNKRLKAFHILRALWNNGFNGGKNVVPQALGYFPEHHLLLYNSYEGESLMQKFETGYKLEDSTPVEAALDWLVEFHQNKPQNINIPEARFSWQEGDEEYKTLLSHLTDKFSSLENRIREAARLIQQQEHKLLNQSTFTLVHGDFQANNILFGHNQTAVIDFNDAFLYDELFDLAYFLTQIKFTIRRLHNLDISNKLKQLENWYLSRRNIPNDAVVQNKLALFSAKTLLRIKILTTRTLGAELLNEIETNVHKTI